MRFVEISPDGQWIASLTREGIVRLWPMPDLAKPPLHTLPHDELMTTLEALTNLRAVPIPKAIPATASGRMSRLTAAGPRCRSGDPRYARRE